MLLYTSDMSGSLKGTYCGSLYLQCHHVFFKKQQDSYICCYDVPRINVAYDKCKSKGKSAKKSFTLLKNAHLKYGRSLRHIGISYFIAVK